MVKLLLSWIGSTDLRAANGDANAGMGPLGQAVMAGAYTQVALLSNFTKPENDAYAQWLSAIGGVSTINIHPAALTSPTNYGEIYTAAVEVASALIRQHGPDAELTFHLSPGTPAMAATWIILSKTRFPAVLIESSVAQGVRTVSIPFDISAEFLPDLLRMRIPVISDIDSGGKPDTHSSRSRTPIPVIPDTP